jgi:hypothetical protein
MGCLSEHNRLEMEAYERQKKDSNWNHDHPGAEPFPDQATRWSNAAAALIEVEKGKTESEEED